MQRSMLVGLIGANVQKSLTPALFEDACAAAGIRAHYHLIDLDRLPGRRLDDLVDAARTLGFTGFNVTFPCKEAIVPLLDDVSDEAREIGAVNTVAISADGRTGGFNTDRVGFRRAFEDEFGRGAAEGATALLVGAGGAGRAVAFALFDLGIEVLLIHDIAMDRAHRLADLLGSRFGPGRARAEQDVRSAAQGAAVVVNATPLGMIGMPGMPIPIDAIRASHWVADVIYTPLETELIKRARQNGSRVMGGASMCVHQAAETFRLFTGLLPDIKRMQRTFAAAALLREEALGKTDIPGPS
jgi:shikimate dehydrogenase